MARPEIVVVNPNSNAAVTAGFDAALAPLRFADGPVIRCLTLEEGPFGVETQEHVDEVAIPLRRLVERERAAAAFVIACYSDPGLHVCREGTRSPVFGIAESALLTALSRGDRFGVIAIGAGSMPRHQRYVRQMGLAERFAGERPLNMSVAESASGEGTLARMIQVGGELVELDRADVIVMGCAGMARHRKALEAALGVPVVDPVQAAVTMAIGAVQIALA
ncbi:aspartate/glutamate racemase family protein [Azorhizobium doebereinerae]|uniref:aspartate/glutamate racemase family protein n=1 Tax=Azorhizobium doebereinerae TaxID=281091 RepID=UPI000423AEAC|nr:aspartate/glutamate racemase family protein [Azorhizobium doebereinerae]